MGYEVIEIHEGLFLLIFINATEGILNQVKKIITDNRTSYAQVASEDGYGYQYHILELYGGDNLERTLYVVETMLDNLVRD